MKTPSVNAIHILSDVFGIDFLWKSWSTHVSIYIHRVYHGDLSVKSNHQVPPPSSTNNTAPIKETLKQREQLQHVVENKKLTSVEKPKKKKKNKSKQPAHFPIQAPKKASQFVRIEPSTHHVFALTRSTNPLIRAWFRKKQADRKKSLAKQVQRNLKIFKAIAQHHGNIQLLQTIMQTSYVCKSVYPNSFRSERETNGP